MSFHRSFVFAASISLVLGLDVTALDQIMRLRGLGCKRLVYCTLQGHPHPLRGGAAESAVASSKLVPVLFQCPKPDTDGHSAHSISVIGSWNSWTVMHALEKTQTGDYQVKLMLPPGKFEYRIVKDGKLLDSKPQQMEPESKAAAKCQVGLPESRSTAGVYKKLLALSSRAANLTSTLGELKGPASINTTSSSVSHDCEERPKVGQERRASHDMFASSWFENHRYRMFRSAKHFMSRIHFSHIASSALLSAVVLCLICVAAQPRFAAWLFQAMRQRTRDLRVDDFEANQSIPKLKWSEYQEWAARCLHRSRDAARWIGDLLCQQIQMAQPKRGHPSISAPSTHVQKSEGKPTSSVRTFLDGSISGLQGKAARWYSNIRAADMPPGTATTKSESKMLSQGARRTEILVEQTRHEGSSSTAFPVKENTQSEGHRIQRDSEAEQLGHEDGTVLDTMVRSLASALEENPLSELFGTITSAKLE